MADSCVSLPRRVANAERSPLISTEYALADLDFSGDAGFLFCGGYANAVSLEGARKREVGYADWLAGRLTRLVTPLLALFVGWALLAGILYLSGVSGEVIGFSSRAALIPTWFLAIYIVVVILAPATYAAWRRWGFASFWAFVVVCALVDVAYFAADIRWLGWSNYFWVWLAVHHLGYAWRDGRVGGPARLVTISALGFLALVLFVFMGPYPVAMVGSPDKELSNSLPPKITLLALGVFQFGLLLAIEGPMRRVLSGLRIWTATVLLNSMIMTVFLWHLTVMVIIVALAYLAGGLGLGLEPGTQGWWLSRPVWLALLYGVLIPVALLMAPLERRARAADAAAPVAAKLVGGAILICLGIAVLSLFGFGGAPVPGLGVVAFLMVVGGAAVSGLLPTFGKKH